VRFQCYKKAIPRREIETLSFLLAFCAGAPAAVIDGPKHRWRLLASLFGNTAGVLSAEYFEPTSIEGIKSPPGKDHITKCEVELDRFRVLVSSETLNPLPDSDSFLTKLIQKCLLLLTDEFRYSLNDVSRGKLFDFDATDCARFWLIWKATQLLNFNSSGAVLFRTSVDPDQRNTECGDRKPGSNTGWLPVCSLLESCVNLSVAWIEQVPNKKARRSRLTQSLRKLVLDCIERASKLEASNASNAQAASASTFEEAFAVKTSNVGSRHAATAYREVAARLSVIGAIGGSAHSALTLTKELRERVSSGQDYHL
jgi:hypothetical protein